MIIWSERSGLRSVECVVMVKVTVDTGADDDEAGHGAVAQGREGHTLPVTREREGETHTTNNTTYNGVAACNSQCVLVIVLPRLLCGATSIGQDTQHAARSTRHGHRGTNDTAEGIWQHIYARVHMMRGTTLRYQRVSM